MRPGPGRLASASAAVGALGWLLLALVGPLAATETLLALAPLVLVPGLLDVVATPTRDGRHAPWYRAAVAGQPVGAAGAAGSLLLAPGPLAGAMAAAWALTTVLLALFGVWRLLQRGLRPVDELLVDAGLLYLPVGGVGLLLHRLGLAPLGFDEALVLLAGVHFHYAGFVLPVLAGISGRAVPDRWRRSYTWLAAVVLAGPALIGLGITFSARVEVAAVSVFTVAVTLLALLWLVAVVPGRHRRPQQLALSLAALVLPASMLLALAFGLSRFLGRPVAGVDVPTMVALHGHLNALGFALLGVVGWRLDIPEGRAAPPGLPFSRLAAGRRVGADYLERAGRAGEGAPVGQVDDLTAYARADFDPESIHPEVRRFYERTERYKLTYRATWQPGFRAGARLAARLTAAIGQLALPGPGAGVRRTDSTVAPIADGVDGRPGARGWVRRDRETGQVVFVAAYATHERDGETFANIALPLPGGNLTAVLRLDALEVDGDTTGLELRSDPRVPGGDPGLYLVTPLVPIRLPAHERFRVWPTESPAAPAFEFSGEETTLVARHEMWTLGRLFLTVDYAISPAPAAA